MSRTIFKYELDIGAVNLLSLPPKSIIRHVGEQNHSVMIWLEIDTSVEKRVCRKFVIFGTGHDIPKDTKPYDGHNAHEFTHEYVGTVQMKNGLVWHVYEEEL